MGSRGSFGSRFGVIAAVSGSVIGLGNIWRFPYVAGENGGAAFILIYIACSFLISIPLMLSEFSLGRSSKRNTKRAFQKLAPGTRWNYVGYMGIFCAFILLSFYCVIAGWALEFIKESVLNEFAGKSAAQISENFNGFIASGWRPVVWMGVFMLSTAFIVWSGIEKGIERYTKIFMPVFIVLLAALAINSLTLPGAREGIGFLLRPDFSKITGATILKAMGQSFFSMSLGLGCMITYGSYIRKGENLPKVASMVALSDMSVAILSGIAIFPAVFSFGISPTSGPELVFLTLPNIFAQMPGRLLDRDRILRTAVPRRNHLVDLDVRSHCRLPDRRVADEPAESRSRRTGHDPGNGFPLRAVAASRLLATHRQHEPVRPVRLPQFERPHAAGRPDDRDFYGLGIFARKTAQRADQQPDRKPVVLSGHPPADPVRRSGGHHTAVPHADRNPVNPQ